MGEMACKSWQTEAVDNKRRPPEMLCSESEKGHWRRNACVFLAYFNAVFRNLKALPITETLLKLIAAAAIMGLSSRSSEIG